MVVVDVDRPKSIAGAWCRVVRETERLLRDENRNWPGDVTSLIQIVETETSACHVMSRNSTRRRPLPRQQMLLNSCMHVCTCRDIQESTQSSLFLTAGISALSRHSQYRFRRRLHDAGLYALVQSNKTSGHSASAMRSPYSRAGLCDRVLASDD